MLIDVKTLREDLKPYFGLFDKPRYKDIKATYDPSRTRGLPAYYLHRAQAHPLAILLHNLAQGVDKSLEKGTIKLSDESIFFIETLAGIMETASHSETEKILRHIISRDQVFSSLFEAHTFSIYRQRGLNITPILEESGNQQRSPDFIVECGGEKVFVECKSLEDKAKRENRYWEQIEGRIVREMQKLYRCWLCVIEVSRSIEGIDIERIIELARFRIKDGCTRPISNADESIKITFSKIMEPNVWNDAPLELPKIGARGWFEIEFLQLPQGRFQCRNPAGIQVLQFDGHDEFKRISGCISKAHRQLPKGYPGIVHIELPFRDGEKLLDIMDPIFSRLFNLLRERRRINVVIISGRVIDKHMKNAENPTLSFDVVIPNPDPVLVLPPGFAVSSYDPDSPLKIEGIGQGTIAIGFGLFEPLDRMLGKNIYYYCGPHGSPQVRLWQSFSNRFRVDVVDINFGRRSFSADLNNLPIGVTNKIAVSWSHDGVSCAANGKLLENEIPHAAHRER